MKNEVLTVTSLREGDEGIVRSIAGGESLTSRLAAMGLVPGTTIKVLRNTGGSVILLASDTRLALGRLESSRVFVSKVVPAAEKETLLVALAGQPNVGKSTVFNILTGLSQHVGNWPGKTVEKKEGIHVVGDIEMRIVDLPGTYSLTAFSEEERAAREFIMQERPDVTVLVVNASALERSLYLLSELLLLNVPVIVAVNMMDVAEDQGIRVDAAALQRSLGIPVVSIIATKNKGIRELVPLIEDAARGKIDYNPRLPDVSADHKAIYLRLMELVADYVPPDYTDRWLATKLMEGDPEALAMLRGVLPDDAWNEIQSLLIEHEDALRAVVGGRYDWIEMVTRVAVSRFKRGQVLMTDRIDHLLTQPLLGIPVLLGILALVFVLTYKVGFPVQHRIEWLMGLFARFVETSIAGVPQWLSGLVVNGIIGGAGSVLTFLPILLIFFVCLTFLEDVGYMARAAFVMDRFMHIVGLHGKSFLPLCLGFGCNVPSVIGARIIESKKARLLTIFLTPFVPCTARLAVLTFVCAAVFAEHASFVSWLLLAINILVLGMCGMIISRVFLKHEPMPFIMELPLYHKPDPRTIAIVVWNRTVAFVKRAGTVIVLASVIVWLLSNMPGGRIETSLLASIGRILEPIGGPMGLGWKEMIALVSSLVAKENAVATLAVLYGVGQEGLREVLPRAMTHASALAFLVVLMLFVPCAATVAVMKQEMGSWKWFLSSFLFMLAISFLGGVVAYHIGVYAGIG
ncbi:MAG: Ferrous iron transport protein B [Syntrophorhabdaceae bacterium PtaU1.Bin034]|nr:MAG: Ferrous iron transport protein B [Syntrophorhabdaceae bacterium PtaU1.Bin034]